MNTTSTNTIRRALVLAACLLGAAAPLQQARAWSFDSGEQVQGSGNVTRQARTVGHFTGLSLAVPGNVELRIGNSEGVTVETDDNLQALVETEVDNGTLRIRPARRNLGLRAHTLKIVVQAREIERVGLAGSGSIEADALRAPKLQFDIGGSGSIDVKRVEAGTVAVSVGGSGSMKAGGGSARQLSVSIAGSGNAELGKVKADNASVNVAGSGEATVWASGALSMTIAGSGDVSYYGDPTLSRSVMGSGEVRRLGAAPR
jgi:hypothetical protein